MKYIYAVLTFCVVTVTCQPRGPPSRPPPPSAAKPTGKPVPISPPRPKGCSPGCGPTEICSELADSYCRPGQSCSVCIKMNSIRFPASALSNILQPPVFRPQPPQPSTSLFPGFGGGSSSSSMNQIDWFSDIFSPQPVYNPPPPPPPSTSGPFGGGQGLLPFMFLGDFGMGF